MTSQFSFRIGRGFLAAQLDKKDTLKMGRWLIAKNHPTKGFANRPGWHCTLQPNAPHLSMKNRVWVQCEIENYEIFERPEKQGGKWLIARKMKIIKEI